MKISSYFIEAAVGIVLGTLLIITLKLILDYSRIEMKKKGEERSEKKCIITEVEYQKVQSNDDYLIDSEWRVTTDCGYTYSVKNKVKVGDTLSVISIKYLK